MPQKLKATFPDSTLRVEMNGSEEQADNAKARDFFWEPLSWLETLRPTIANDAWDQPLWDICTTLGLEVPVRASVPRRNNSSLAQCSCKKHGLDLHGDQTSTCTAHSGATKAHDWAIGILGPLFRTAGHTVRTQHGVTASAGQRRGDVEIRNYVRDQAGSPGLRPVHHERPVWLKQPRAAEVCYRIPRTSTRLRALLRSTRSIAIGSNTLTIRTFLFSPPS